MNLKTQILVIQLVVFLSAGSITAQEIPVNQDTSITPDSIVFQDTTGMLDTLLAADTSIVRIRVDRDSIQLSLDGQILDQDSYGNNLTRGNWFILQVFSGEHQVTFRHELFVPVDTLFTIDVREIVTLDLTLIPLNSTLVEEIEEIPTGIAYLEVLSEPDSAIIYVNQNEVNTFTPSMVTVVSGEAVLETFREGYEPLSKKLMLEPYDTLSMRFLLKEMRPVPIVPESLGLEKRPVMTLIDEKTAEAIQRQFNGFAESFAIVPLAQGLVAKLLVGSDSQNKANVLVISGVTLTAGSYLLGKILTARRRGKIKEENGRIAQANIEAKEHNLVVDRSVREENNDRLNSWREENKEKGKVIIERD